MIRKPLIFLFFLVILMLTVGSVGAQSIVTTDDETTATDGSNVIIFVVICENQAVVNLSGNMDAGDDLYFQLFMGSQGTGEALSALRQVAVDGTYTFSENVAYPEGKTIPGAGFGSLYVSISREGDPENSSFSEYVDDIQDGCAEPQFPLGVSEDIDGDGTTTPVDATLAAAYPGDRLQPILSPFGGVINPGWVPPAIPSEFERPRQATPGIIFAECNDHRMAEPGLVYDTDEVVIFWSWFAQTPELVQEHLNNVDYSVTYYQTLQLPNLDRTEIQEINGDYWIFLYSRLGNLRPGRYYFEYKVQWNAPVSDGYAEYGPGTENPLLISGCGFDMLPNPEGTVISHNSWPYQ